VRRYATVSLVLGLLCAGPALAQPPLLELLRAAATGQDDVPYEAVTTTTFRAQNGLETSYSRHVYAGHGGRHVTWTEGGGPCDSTTICDGRRRWRVLSRTVAFVGPAIDPQLQRRRRVEFAERMARDGWAVLRGSGRRAGRPVWQVTLYRQEDSDWVPFRGLEIDKETYVELGNITYARDGSPLSTTVFDTVRYLSDDEVDESRFEFEPGEDVLVLPEPGRLGRIMPFRDAKETAPWLVPLRSRPRWWRPTGVALAAFGPKVVGQFFYVAQKDGEAPRPVYFLQKRVGDEAPFFDAFFGTKDAGIRPIRRRQAIVWADDDRVYVLASTVPLDELERIAWEHAEQGDTRP